jgi:hypothetical protein
VEKKIGTLSGRKQQLDKKLHLTARQGLKPSTRVAWVIDPKESPQPRFSIRLPVIAVEVVAGKARLSACPVNRNEAYRF